MQDIWQCTEFCFVLCVSTWYSSEKTILNYNVCQCKFLFCFKTVAAILWQGTKSKSNTRAHTSATSWVHSEVINASCWRIVPLSTGFVWDVQYVVTAKLLCCSPTLHSTRDHKLSCTCTSHNWNAGHRYLFPTDLLVVDKQNPAAMGAVISFLLFTYFLLYSESVQWYVCVIFECVWFFFKSE